MDKNEFLIGEDLGAKFEYSPLDKVFNKWLDEKEKKGFWKD